MNGNRSTITPASGRVDKPRSMIFFSAHLVASLPKSMVRRVLPVTPHAHALKSPSAGRSARWRRRGSGLHVGAAQVAAEVFSIGSRSEAVAVPARCVARVHALECAPSRSCLQDLCWRRGPRAAGHGLRRAVVQHGAVHRGVLRAGACRCLLIHSSHPTVSRLGRSPRMGNGVSGRFSVAR